MTGETRDLAAQVESDWQRFRVRLADRLAAMAEDEILLVEVESGVDEDELTGAAPYLQLIGWGEDMVRAEAVSNTYLDERYELSSADEERLADMGWESPRYDADGNPISGEANFFVDAETREADRLAVLAVRALREVYGCPHPAFLDADGLERDGEPAVESPAETLEPVAVFPQDQEHLQGLVDAALAVMFEEPPEHDADGDLPITCGASQVFVRVRDDHPAVEVWADVVIGLKDVDGVAEALDELNLGELHRQFFLRDDRVVARVVLPAWPFAPAQLRLVVGLFCEGLDDLAAELVTRVGGRRFLEPRPFPPRPGCVIETQPGEAIVGLLEMLHVGTVSTASVAILFDHDRLEIIRQLVAIRTGVQSCDGLDEELVLNHLRRALRSVVDRSARAERSRGRRSQQLSLHLDGDVSQDTLDNGLWNREVS